MEPTTDTSGVHGAGHRLHRTVDDRVVGGVAGGIGARLGVDPVLVRIGFVVLTFAGGFGLLLYGALWAALPSEPPDAPRTVRPATTQQGVALALVLLGLLLLLRGVGLWFGDAVVVPIVFAAAGSAVVWARSDDDDRARWSAATAQLRPGAAVAASAPASPARVIVGTLLVAVAVAGFLAAHDAFRALWDVGLALVAALAGIALLFGPWLFHLTQQLTSERRERIRQEERAEVAAHLHDSVLQTLALIQRSADDPQRTAALARRQERELRGWLYGSRASGEGTLSGAIQQVVDEVETDHAIAVEAVLVGDAPLDDEVRALVAAVREACINAARHSEAPTVDVYVEASDTRVTAFVRDRGVGFDPARVEADRQGIRQSIVARMERNGGEARVESSPSSGTEVELRLRRTPTEESS